ncbi:sulfate permease SutB-Penicillium chrysogenum [Penicillium mononematosum]|uniref:sulfate permease SutB-Penicillium chrysogenum n=1 Tax=Penicillium mononematosum TaxID=268346 RepID=UPI002548A580|nr:sulfate permease SutB-Penicillium chrysogenum [Penicillium mononematosum]KAJ6190868.1 sulfate permease SutB-Penicillium chrysogenum [Penicillium mononematosum]
MFQKWGETNSNIGQSLAKVLGIKLAYRDPLGATGETVTRGESAFSMGTVDTYSYNEPEPTSIDWIREITPSGAQLGRYLLNLFPFLTWIGNYNLTWLWGDLVAGITVGAVVVPQGMAYANLAGLPVQFGLYSSFMGVLIYWFFATSKDITIGPVAVMSTLTGTIVANVREEYPDYPPHLIASALAVICGGIVLVMGLLRIGFIVDFIPLPAISAFMTGSALSICSGQVPTMLGETADFSTRGATYEVIINTLKYLPTSTLDAAMGVTACAMLYIIRSVCSYAAKKQPARAKIWFFVSTLRTVFVILFYTMIIPRGFQQAAVPTMDTKIIKAFVGELPAAVIVLLIEHIAISKSFGRVNNYTIDPSQEFVAIGVSNLLGPFLGGYPATGSFSRTAIKSKAGVRTPLAGVITAVVVLLAIYALPALFFYIPKASLAGVIIHAVGDLITPPNTVYQFWRVSPLDAIIFFLGVIVTVFSSIENGIYCTVCVAVAVLLFRVAKARGQFLGRVTIHSVVGDHLLDGDGKYGSFGTNKTPSDDEEHHHRTIFLPLNHTDGSNPDIEVEQPLPGIFIYRFAEGFNCPNANHYTDSLVENIFKNTRRTNPNAYKNRGDRPWNDAGPRRGKEGSDDDSHLPLLQAVILDFSSVNNVDVTSIQNLIDVRNQLDMYASPRTVQWHFAHINNRWTKRGLAAAGFGYPTPVASDGFHRWKPIFSVAEIEGSASAAAHAEIIANQREQSHKPSDIESGFKSDSNATARETDGIETASEDSEVIREDKFNREITDSKAYQRRPKVALVQGMNRPFFHIDLTSALQSAVANSSDEIPHIE